MVLHREDELGLRSVRNMPDVHVLFVDQLNTYDVLCADDIVFTKPAFDQFVSGRGSADFAVTDGDSSVGAEPAGAAYEVTDGDDAVGTDAVEDAAPAKKKKADSKKADSKKSEDTK